MAFALDLQISPQFQKADSRVNDKEMWRRRKKEKFLMGKQTGNNLDYQSAT